MKFVFEFQPGCKHVRPIRHPEMPALEIRSAEIEILEAYICIIYRCQRIRCIFFRVSVTKSETGQQGQNY
jgi:hypothetical protein